MAALTIPAVDPSVEEHLRLRAARNGRSIEAEVLHILREAVGQRPAETGLAEAIRARFAPFGGVEHLPPHPAVKAGAGQTFEL